MQTVDMHPRDPRLATDRVPNVSHVYSQRIKTKNNRPQTHYFHAQECIFFSLNAQPVTF